MVLPFLVMIEFGIKANLSTMFNAKYLTITMEIKILLT